MNKEIAVSIIITTKCNLKCNYCINNSGSDLKIDNTQNEWKNVDEIILCLKKISEVRDISIIKFFGGEPLLCANLIKEVIEHKKDYSSNSKLSFALTTNGYEPIKTEIVDYFIKNKVIVNFSVDGPQKIHDLSRVNSSGIGSYEKVLSNIVHFKEKNFPIAIISVLDERIVENNISLIDLCIFLSKISHIYKVEAVYKLKNDVEEKMTYFLYSLIEKEKQLIDYIFQKIRRLEIKDFIFENNILRTIYNCVYGYEKKYVCSASDHITIFPNKSAYNCYNLKVDNYKICDSLDAISSELLEKTLRLNKEKLLLKNFQKEYSDVLLFGDYCPKENNFGSFAYLYRKTMIEEIKRHLTSIETGTKEHLSLLGYLALGFDSNYYKNVPFLNQSVIE